MVKNDLTQKTIVNIQKLSATKVKEVNEFVEFLLNRKESSDAIESNPENRLSSEAQVLRNRELNKGFFLDEIYEFNNSAFAYEDFEITNSFGVLNTYFAILEKNIIQGREVILREGSHKDENSYFSKDDELFEIMKVTRYSGLVSIFSNFEYILFRICERYSKKTFNVDFIASGKSSFGNLKEHIIKKIIGDIDLGNIESIYQTITTISKLRNIVVHYGGLIVKANCEEYKLAKGTLKKMKVIIGVKNISHDSKILIFKKGLLDFTLSQMHDFFDELIQKLDEKYEKNQLCV